jgi:hypothetical protein
VNTLGGREDELDLGGGKGRKEVVEEVGAGATDANVILLSVGMCKLELVLHFLDDMIWVP